MEQTDKGLTGLKGLQLGEGMLCIGKFRGYDERQGNDGKTYMKIKVLVGDNVKKFDIRAEQIARLSDLKEFDTIAVQYYEFAGKFGVNFVCTDAVKL